MAVSISLSVTEPAMSGIGGQTQMMIRPPGKNPICINGTSRSPEGTPTDASESDIVAHKSTTIPSTVRVLDYAWKKYGSGKLAWVDLIKPAIKYAEEGFVVGPFRHRVWARHQEDLLGHPSTRTLFLDEDGTIPEEGALWKQSVLAETLRRLAAKGADEFYSGTIARDIAKDMDKNGGWITLEDLQSFPQPVELQPLESSYRDWKVFTLPPPGGGWVVLQILNLLERVPATQLRPESLERSVRLAEVLLIGQNERKVNPVKDLIDYHEDTSTKISKKAAGYVIEEPRWDLAGGDLNPYFGGVHAVAKKDGVWRAAADPRRDGVVKYAELKH